MIENQRRVIVNQQPDFFREARDLMHSYFRFQLEKGKSGPTFAAQPLVTRSERFTLSPEDMGAAFSDMAAYLGRVRAEAEPVLAAWPGLEALYRVLPTQGEDAADRPFPEGALGYLSAPDAGHFTRDDLAVACQMQLRSWAGDLDELSLDNQQALEALTHPLMDMGAIFDAVNRVSMNDDQRMTLLRFFQELDAWHPRFRDLLSALEQICRAHYPLVTRRFERKARALEDAGAQAEPLKWLARMGSDIADFRPQDPMYLTLSLLGYNGLGFHLHMDRRLQLQAQYGILFQELDALQDKRRARDDLTDRQLKAIADPTRLAIVRSLAAGEQYVQQLADSLGLTPATLSHHLNALLSALLVGLRTQGRRSYYHLNRSELSALADDLHRLSKPTGEDA